MPPPDAHTDSSPAIGILAGLLLVPRVFLVEASHCDFTIIFIINRNSIITRNIIAVIIISVIRNHSAQIRSHSSTHIHVGAQPCGLKPLAQTVKRLSKTTTTCTEFLHQRWDANRNKVKIIGIDDLSPLHDRHCSWLPQRLDTDAFVCIVSRKQIQAWIIFPENQSIWPPRFCKCTVIVYL